jgi:flagellar protein FlbD
MIALTRLDGRQLAVNAEHILTVEATPDTLLLLTTGLHIMVQESLRDVMERAIAYRQRTLGTPPHRAPVLPLHTVRPEDE